MRIRRTAGGEVVSRSTDDHFWQSVDQRGDDPHSILRWAIDFQRDWASRADWCIKDFADANHAPVVRVLGELDRRVKPGEAVLLSAEGTIDPDGDALTYRWWQYVEAGNASAVEISRPDSYREASFIVPDEPGKTLHIVLSVTDSGDPALTRWQRIVFDISD